MKPRFFVVGQIEGKNSFTIKNGVNGSNEALNLQVRVEFEQFTRDGAITGSSLYEVVFFGAKADEVKNNYMIGDNVCIDTTLNSFEKQTANGTFQNYRLSGSFIELVRVKAVKRQETQQQSERSHNTQQNYQQPRQDNRQQQGGFQMPSEDLYSGEDLPF